MSRTPTIRGTLAAWSAAALLALAGPAFARRPDPLQDSNLEPSTPVRAVLGVGLTVSDLDRSVEFFTRVLDAREVARRELAGEQDERLTGVFGSRRLVATLALGDERIELSQFLAPEGRPIPADTRGNDRWFQHVAIVVSDMDRAYARLRAHGVRHASSGPQTLPRSIPGAAGISAFYFKDPDGHFLEVIHFPPGKGEPRWHERAGDALFLGIDHTAITVADTDASLRFYRDVLGMTVAGESENFGTEQEHLNNVFGARLRITGLRAPSGMGIELLEYLSPAGGRAYPEGSRPNDLWHWHVALEADPESFEPRLRAARAPRVSPGVIEASSWGESATRSMLARDPDGHALLFVNTGDLP